MVGGSPNTYAKAIFLYKSLDYDVFFPWLVAHQTLMRKQHSCTNFWIMMCFFRVWWLTKHLCESNILVQIFGLRCVFSVVGGSPNTYAKAIFLYKSLDYDVFFPWLVAHQTLMRKQYSCTNLWIMLCFLKLSSPQRIYH